jgi:uncharacterized protein (DUF2236 family)
MIFGTLPQALAASRHLYQLHTRIKGELPESVAGYPQGSPYEANEVNALLWVYATLIESALLAYDSVLPPLSLTEREAYYTESKTLAALFGIPPAALPVDWSRFEAYSRAMLTSDMLESMRSRERWRTVSCMVGDPGCRFLTGIVRLLPPRCPSGCSTNLH